MNMKYIHGNASSDLSIRHRGPRRSRMDKTLVSAWRGVFMSWGALHHRYVMQEGSDIGWWWKERPSVSFLANAVCMEGGSALQEYKTDKLVELDDSDPDDTREGRADLYVSIAGLGMVIEAKHAFHRLDTPGDQTLTNAMANATSDIERVMEGYDFEGAAAFCSVYAGGSRSPADVRRFVASHRSRDWSALGSEFDHFFQVDLFPTWVDDERTRSSDGREAHPGVSLFMGFDRL